MSASSGTPGPDAGLYPSLLGASWGALAAPVQRLHDRAGPASGVFAVRRGQGWFARALASLLGMPPSADAVAITLRVEPSPAGERWVRDFGGHALVTAQWSRDGLLVEAMGLTQCWFRLIAVEGALVFEQLKATFGLRRFAVPLPRWLAPRVAGRAEARASGVHVSVQIRAPLVGLLVSYEGSVTAEAA